MGNPAVMYMYCSWESQCGKSQPGMTVKPIKHTCCGFVGIFLLRKVVSFVVKFRCLTVSLCYDVFKACAGCVCLLTF